MRSTSTKRTLLILGSGGVLSPMAGKAGRAIDDGSALDLLQVSTESSEKKISTTYSVSFHASCYCAEIDVVSNIGSEIPHSS